MRKILAFILLFSLLFSSCKEETEQMQFVGTYVSNKVIDNSTIRLFNNNGEIKDPLLINRLLKNYNSFLVSVSNLTGEIFTKPTFLVSDSIIISLSSIRMKGYGLNLNYKYLYENDFLKLTSEDSISLLNSFIDNYQTQLNNSITRFQTPTFNIYHLPLSTGYASMIKFLDKRYIKPVDSKIISVPYVRILCLSDYENSGAENFNAIPSEINNILSIKDYSIIGENRAILVKEYEVEYKKQ